MDSPAPDRFVGRYLIGSCGILSITCDGEQLSAQMSGQPKLPKAQGIQSVKFKEVSEVGADNYIVTYHDGQQSHCLMDLDSGGKIALLAFLPKFPYL